jgi:Na+-translocating ferredoxin:NAD+ oxidoreductase RNF subunit RnfB
MIGLTQNVYRKLAQRLDAIPNGFPQTKSGVELRLLAKMYTVEEAALASEMRLTPEIPEQIARKTGKDPAATKIMLESMVEKGLIRATGKRGERKFGLMPFVVGVYEMQLSRLDKEEALLFEEYYGTFAEEVLSKEPSLHVVIPVEKSIPFEVQVFPYEQVSQMLETAKSFGVRKCICRVQKSLVGEPCKYPLETCLVFAPFEGAFQNDPDIRALTREEAFKILRETEEAGLIHSSANIREGRSYICNCCTCCCGIIRGLSQFGIENSVAKSDFFAAVDPELCTGCGTCLKRCQFSAPKLTSNVSYVNQKHCVGCGLCIITCPTSALSLVRKSEKQKHVPPRDQADWMARRAKKRGISMQDIL